MPQPAYRACFRFGVLTLLLAPALWYGSDLAAQATAQEYLALTFFSIHPTTEDFVTVSLERAKAITESDARVRVRPTSVPGHFLLSVPGQDADSATENTRKLFTAMVADFSERGKPPLSLDQFNSPQPVRAAWARLLMERAQMLAWALGLCSPVLFLIGFWRKTKALPPPLPSENSERNLESKFDY